MLARTFSTMSVGALCPLLTAHIDVMLALHQLVGSPPSYPPLLLRAVMPQHNYNGTGKGSNAGLSWTAQAVNLTSQAWLTEADWGAEWGGKDAQWWHVMYIITPSVVTHADWRSLYITGLNNKDPIPSATGEDLAITAALAMSTGQVYVTLFQVPNFPIYLKNEHGDGQDSRPYGDDDLLAHTFTHYMDYVRGGGDPLSAPQSEWVVLLPMTKAAFAAMAAAEEILHDTAGKTNWIVSGASKRGWTTWLVGAVDSQRDASVQRVRAINPIVLDGLHFEETLKLHYSAYGGWSFTMRAFQDAGFTGRIDSAEVKHLWSLIDPYYYASRLLQMPKYVMDGTGDEWFIPDDSRYWIDSMRDGSQDDAGSGNDNDGLSKLTLGMFPDSDHSMAFAIPAFTPSLSVWMNSVIANAPIPRISWSLDYTAGQIVVRVAPAFAQMKRTVQVWRSATCQAESPRRDFRLINHDMATFGKCPCGPQLDDKSCFNVRTGIWTNSTLTADNVDATGLTYIATETPPARVEQRWVGLFVTVTFHDVLGSTPAAAAAVGRVGGTGGAQEQEQESCEMHVIGDRKHCLPVVQAGDMMISTQVLIVPDYRPFTCYGEQCQGGALL